ncbi:trypsin-like peptidase domain-containing protein [Planktotalea sp.]|uniref:trypsin-like serine peptidase n=1 Tax=Planktotalea sp. TaxID=2029877 RepID=UPI003298676F
MPVAAHAQKSTSLTSLTQRDDFLGLEAVGRLDTGASTCSATLIASDLVLTAAHCVYKSGTKEQYRPDELTFRAALTNGEALAERRGYRLAVDAAYDFPGPLTRARVISDIALILLDDPIPTSIASPFALHSGDAIDGPVSIVSYGRGRNEQMSWQRACNILQRDRGLVIMDCDVTYGSSGSAIFARENGRYRVLSLTSAIGLSNGKRVAFGMELGARVESLKQQLRNAPVRRSTAEKRITVDSSSRQTSQARFLRVGD